MTFKEADSLCKKILVFLHKQGGAYREIKDIATMQKVILTALATGRFFYDGTAFVCWEFRGDLMFVQDAAGDFKKIRNALRKNIKTGIAWNNQKKGKSVCAEGKRK